ncbi:MAG: hypothetical protein ACXABD_11150 [Candidatus Thorarchaeota archaeon]|jgi:hypothetical protein
MAETVLELDVTTTPGELEVFPAVRSEAFSGEMQEYLATIHSIRTGVPIERASAEIASLGEDMLREQSRSEASAIIRDEASRAAEVAVGEGSLDGVRAATEQQGIDTEVVKNTTAPEFIAETRTNPGDIWDSVSSRTAARDAAIVKKISEAAAGAEGGVLNWVLDFVDIMVSFPIDALAGGGFTRAGFAQKVQNLRSADIPEEEFNELLEEAIEAGRDAGAFTDENSLMLFGQIENIKQAGIGSEARLDKAFTVLDLLSIPSALSTVGRVALRGLRGARNTTAVVGALRGPKAAGDNLASALVNPGSVQADVAGIPSHTLPGYLRHPDSGVDTQAWSAPGFDKAAKAERDNLFLNVIRNFGFSQRINPEVFEAWRPQGVKILNQEIEATSRSNVLTMRVDPDGQGNIFGSILFGRRDQTPWPRKAEATKFANRHGGTVVPIVQGNTTSFMVEQVSNIPTAGLVKPITAEEIGNHFFGEFGSTFLSVPRRLETLAKRGEGVLNRISVEIAPILSKAIKATSKEERKVVEALFWELRDGDTLSKTRSALTPAGFRDEFYIRNNNVAATKDAEELYNTIQELNDALYFLKADVIFKQAVNEGGQVFKLRSVNTDGIAVERNLIVSKASDDIDPTTTVYNPISGVRTAAGDLKPNQKVFRVAGGLKVGEEVATHIVVDNPELRRLFHTDVLGYNPGGPRGYEFINFGVGQRSTVNIMGQGPKQGREKLLMGTATRSEATLAKDQLNSILAKIREMVPNLKGLSQAHALDALRGIGNDPDLLAVVLRNNDWNTDVSSVTDFIKVVEDHGLDLRENFGLKHMDDAFGVADDTGDLVFGGRAGETTRDAFESRLNQPRNGPRGNDPLIGMGGTSAPTISPIDMISRDFIRVTHERAFSAYNFQAVEGWNKGAAKHIVNDVSGLSPRQAMDAAIFPNNPDAAQRGYITARDNIKRTLGSVSKYEQKWNGLMNRLAEFVYDKGFTTKKGLKGIPLSIADAQQSKSPLTALRGFAFHAKLGVMALDQLFVQSSQIFNILAIAGPLKTTPALASYGPLRMTMVNTSREFALEVGRRVSPFIGMSAEEFADFSRFFNESGRGIIGGEVGELNAVSHTMAKGFWKRAGDVSRTFFDEGERIPRGAAMHVAWKEYREAFPKLDPFKDHGVNWITNRQDALTAAMTRVSAAPWQKGPLSVPLQFMSYTSKMMESLFSSRLLTKAERIRLGGAQMLFWGASGTVFGGPVLDYFVTEGGLELDGDTYTALRYGILDSIIGQTTGVDTAFGERLAVGEGIWNMWEDFNNEGLFETLGGPSLQVGADVTTSLLSLMGEVATGNTSMVAADLKKFMRDFTGPNKLYNAWVIYNTGDYLSRNGAAVASGLQNTDAMLHLIGAPLQEVSLTYTRIQAFKNQDDHLRKYGNRIAQIAREMRASVKAGDFDKAHSQAQLMAAYVAALPRWQQAKARKFYVADASPLLRDIILEGRKRHMKNLNILDDEGE